MIRIASSHLRSRRRFGARRRGSLRIIAPMTRQAALRIFDLRNNFTNTIPTTDISAAGRTPRRTDAGSAKESRRSKLSSHTVRFICHGIAFASGTPFVAENVEAVVAARCRNKHVHQLAGIGTTGSSYVHPSVGDCNELQMIAIWLIQMKLELMATWSFVNAFAEALNLPQPSIVPV